METGVFSSPVVDLLKIQTNDAQTWVRKLLADFPDEKWFLTPQVVDTNLAWQIGHLILSEYYYSVVLLAGPRNEISENFDVKKYSAFFARGDQRKQLEYQISVKDLIESLELVQETSLQLISNLTSENLASDIYPIKEHPFVKTKLESISWNIKHTMWHCGQIATLRRVIDKPINYGM
jgi:hypothetical protein